MDDTSEQSEMEDEEDEEAQWEKLPYPKDLLPRMHPVPEGTEIRDVNGNQWAVVEERVYQNGTSNYRLQHEGTGTLIIVPYAAIRTHGTQGGRFHLLEFGTIPGVWNHDPPPPPPGLPSSSSASSSQMPPLPPVPSSTAGPK